MARVPEGFAAFLGIAVCIAVAANAPQRLLQPAASALAFDGYYWDSSAANEMESLNDTYSSASVYDTGNSEYLAPLIPATAPSSQGAFQNEMESLNDAFTQDTVVVEVEEFRAQAWFTPDDGGDHDVVGEPVWSRVYALEEDPEIDDTYYRRSVYREEEPWYERIVPVSYISCTYFGTWCDGGNPFGRVGSTYASYMPSAYAPQYYGSAVMPTQSAKMPRCRISASPAALSERGSVLLQWDSEDAARATMEGVGAVPASGVRGVDLSQSRGFVLTVYNEHGQASSCSSQVTVSHQGAGGACTMSVSPVRTLPGNPVELRWSAPTSERTVLDGFGPVDNLGTWVMYPDKTTTYTLRFARGNGQTGSCVAVAHVDSERDDSFEGWLSRSRSEFQMMQGGNSTRIIQSVPTY